MGCIWLLMGCAEVMVSGSIAGGGEYYHYTTSNIAKETLMGDVRDVTAARKGSSGRWGWGLRPAPSVSSRSYLSGLISGKMSMRIDDEPK